MDKKTRIAVNITGYILLITLIPKLLRMNLTAGATFLGIIVFVGIIYEIYVYSTTKKDTTAGATIAVFAVLIIAGIAILASPQIQEDIEEGKIIIPTNEATVTITADNSHVLLDKDYKLYRNNELIRTFHLKAWEQLTIAEKIKWTGNNYKTVTYKLVSSGANGIGDRSTSQTVVLNNNTVKTIALSA